VVDHVKPFAGHFIHAVYIDWFQKLRFDKRHTVRPAIRLPRSRINDTRLAILQFARLEDSQGCDGIHLQVLERLLHGFDVTDMARKIEDVRFVANELPNQLEITAIAHDDFDIVLNLLDIETISAASRMEGIQKSHRSPVLNKTMSKIASDEAETAGD